MLRGEFSGEILAPRDNLHAERLGHRHHIAPLPPQAQQAQRAPVQRKASGILPAALPHFVGFKRNVPCHSQHQPPRQFTGSLAIRATQLGKRHHNAALGGRGDIQRTIVKARDSQHFEVRQLRQQCAINRHALAQRTDNVKRLERCRHFYQWNGTVKHRDVASLGDVRPICGDLRAAQIVVEDGDFHAVIMA